MINEHAIKKYKINENIVYSITNENDAKITEK